MLAYILGRLFSTDTLARALWGSLTNGLPERGGLHASVCYAHNSMFLSVQRFPGPSMVRCVRADFLEQLVEASPDDEEVRRRLREYVILVLQDKLHTYRECRRKAEEAEDWYTVGIYSNRYIPELEVKLAKALACPPDDVEDILDDTH